MANRNSEALAAFVQYCNEHPEQRFWQALRNWSKYHTIYGYNGPSFALEDELSEQTLVFLDNTFNLEGLDGTRP